MPDPGSESTFMLKAKRILLASHGTEGARAAEELALTLCPEGGALTHLIVVPDFWKGSMGDDWLNNASTRDVFGKYLESRLGQEVQENIERVEKQAEHYRLSYEPQVVVGKPPECLIDCLKANAVDLVVFGSPRPRGKQGLRSRMLTDAVLRAASVPVLVVPYPDD